MTTIVIQDPAKKTGPQPAVGLHAEMLAEITQTANGLLKLVELERSGIYDGTGQNFWIGYDSVLNMAQKVLALTEQLRAELRDAGPR